MRRTDPRIRQTLNQISQTVESAQYSTQASLFSFTQNYLTPCFASISSCLEASCHPCYQCLTSRSSDPHHGRKRHPNRRRGREELSFDFYDDWEEDEREWGNDELDRLLAGNEQDNSGQPSRKRGMSYGGIVSRRKTMSLGGHHHNAKDAAADANIVPSSSMFGFLERLPWKIGGRGRRYRPSAADLQDVGEGTRTRKPTPRYGEDEPLISESEDEATTAAGGRLGIHKQQQRHHGRNRSATMSSRETTTSLSSRGDLLPSEDEDDAVPLDDEFTIALERRTTTGTTSDEHSKRGGAGESRASTKTKSSADTRSSKKRRGTSAERDRGEQPSSSPPSMTDLKEEEERLRIDEEAAVERGREAAQRLARERGLSGSQQQQQQQNNRTVST
ncbi:MAG: hypothetical protein LQ351_000248 [Letrouitia transgressa]|nr:MAG: hypothetical protein LQ351_000248 [Letrouitia transgressa]